MSRATTSGGQAAIKIGRDLRSIKDDPVEGVFCELVRDNLFQWDIWFEGPGGSVYQGGIFQARMEFPEDYPMSPPTLIVLSEFWHPNVYANGKVCISILHAPGNDPMSGELPEERWLPTQTVSTIMLSFQSMLSDPNINSPANIDASVMWRDRPEEFARKAQLLIERANANVPEHVKIPHPDTDPVERMRTVEKMKKIQEASNFTLHDDNSDSVGYGDLDSDGEGDGDDEEISEEVEEEEDEDVEEEEAFDIVDCPVCKTSMLKPSGANYLQCAICPIRKKKDQFLCSRKCYKLDCGEVLPTGICTVPITANGGWKCSSNTHKDDPNGEENFLCSSLG